MGDDHPFDDPSDTECHHPCAPVRLPLEEAQSKCQGKAWQRVPSAHRGTHARQQVFG